MATPLKFLLDEINFQRTKELMRQSLREEGGFVMLQGANTFWTDLFVRHFLFETEASMQDSDDLLFFVRYKHVKGSSRINPKYETDINVFRRDSRKLPIGDPEINWEETVYLNLVIHQFDYKLTLAICTRTSPKELQVLRRHSQKVYASPSRRKMDSKGDSEEITYPNICFMVDNFDEIFKDILVRDGEMVCVELVANDKDGTAQGVIFLGSIRYEALKKVYDARQSSLSAKVAQRMSFGLLGGASQTTRCEFVRMKGPQGKGHAEMAVTKPKGNSGVETPTSEPGYCMTDFEADWEDDSDFFNYRHRRRLSDPSANLNNFNRYAFRSMAPSSETAAGKARSENEGLDSLANELYEVEAGDLRDDRPAARFGGYPGKAVAIGLAAALDIPTGGVRTAAAASDRDRRRASYTCCNCFGQPRRLRSKCLSTTSSGMDEMSDVCGRHSEGADGDLEEEKEDGEVDKAIADQLGRIAIGPRDEEEEEEESGKARRKGKKPEMIKMKPLNGSAKDKENNGDKVSEFQEYELADDAINELGEREGDKNLPGNGTEVAHRLEKTSDDDEDDFVKIGCAKNGEKLMGKEELPVAAGGQVQLLSNSQSIDDAATPVILRWAHTAHGFKDKFATFPRMNRRRRFYNKIAIQRPSRRKSVPTRVTKDGTSIFYWCDTNRKPKELDDGAYNPIWTSRGFTQSFHFWKESKRQSSTPLNALLTYVSLPWWNIAKDLLDKKDPPILTF